VNVLFLGRHYTYFRNFDSVIRELASRGHRIHLVVERGDPEGLGGIKLVEAIAADHPAVTHGEAPGRTDDRWAWTAGRLRLGIDYLRYQQSLFDRSPKLRERSRERTPAVFVAAAAPLRALGGWALDACARLVRRLEAAIPEDPAVGAFLDAQHPDLVLVTPLLSLGSSQIDYLRAARARRIPTALCVWSWDHLSSKALIRERPDRVFVWNQTQKREAVELHAMPADRVVVTGAQCFDQWFDRAPSRTREEFCRQVGLPADRPFVLYVCSALLYGSPPEAPFAVEWIRRVRASSSSRLRDAGILVRPHPSRTAEWQGVETRDLQAVVWGGNPVDTQSKADYYDSLYHAAAVAGINTSAFIEAAIVGRPVHALVLPETEENQTGTVHFEYLLRVGGGFVEVAHSFDEHLAQLDRALAAPRHEVKPFVREFVRPHGLDRPATPLFAGEVEALAGRASAPLRQDRLAPLWAWLLERIARLQGSERAERWVLSPREYESAQGLRHMREVKAIRRAQARAAKDATRLADLEAREARLAERQRQRDEWRRAKREAEARGSSR